MGQYDFNLAPQHVYGSFEVSNRAIERTVLTAAGESTLHQEDPIQRSGLGGLYQYGHDTFNSLEHNQKLDGSSTIGTHWDHYKQARHAGCLYEKSDWSYSHTTFDKVYVANYYQGYGDFTSGTFSMPTCFQITTVAHSTHDHKRTHLMLAIWTQLPRSQFHWSWPTQLTKVSVT